MAIPHRLLIKPSNSSPCRFYSGSPGSTRRLRLWNRRHAYVLDSAGSPDSSFGTPCILPATKSIVHFFFETHGNSDTFLTGQEVADSPYSVVVTPGVAHGLSSSAYGASVSAALATIDNIFYVQVKTYSISWR